MADDTRPVEPRRPARAREENTSTPSGAPATEKPVPSRPAQATSQFAVTVDHRSGLPTKIEKIDAATGAKKEVTLTDYAAMMTGSADAATAATASGGSQTMDPQTLAYYQ